MTQRLMRPGPRNLITDVPGLRVGNAVDMAARTGVTVVLPGSRMIAAVDVRGGAPGTRETDALAPDTLVDAVDALVLSGGSVFGLAAADGVTAALARQGRGYHLAGSNLVAPVVPAAILFDLTNGGDKAWGDTPPYRALGAKALAAAAEDFTLGNEGAGLGAKAGAYKGGLGSASLVSADGLIAGALIAANPFGSPLIPGTRSFWAYALEQNGELGGQRPPALTAPLDLSFPADSKAPQPKTNTTIGVVAVNAALTPAEARRIALMAHDGLAMACRPMHTLFDGDVLFALASGELALPEPRALYVSRLGLMAADCAARALARGVYEAKSLGGMTAYRDLPG